MSDGDAASTEPAGLDLALPAAPKRRARKRAPKHTWVVRAFGASWCAPWPLAREQLQLLADDGVSVVIHDVDADSAVAERHRIIAVPTVVIERDGQERRRVLGAFDAGDIRALLT